MRRERERERERERNERDFSLLHTELSISYTTNRKGSSVAVRTLQVLVS